MRLAPPAPAPQTIKIRNSINHDQGLSGDFAKIKILLLNSTFFALFSPVFRAKPAPVTSRRLTMEFTTITFDQIGLAIMACIGLREAMIMFLPNAIAGPGGSLVDTSQHEE
jgi:hypothetical protein